MRVIKMLAGWRKSKPDLVLAAVFSQLDRTDYGEAGKYT